MDYGRYLCGGGYERSCSGLGEQLETHGRSRNTPYGISHPESAENSCTARLTKSIQLVIQVDWTRIRGALESHPSVNLRRRSLNFTGLFPRALRRLKVEEAPVRGGREIALSHVSLSPPPGLD